MLPVGIVGAPKLRLRRAGDRLRGGFGGLELLEELRLQPGAGTSRRVDHELELITYVREGALAYDDSTGRSGIIDAGEFQCLTVGRGLRLGLASASRVDGAHAFQLRLRQRGGGVEPGREQRRFSAAERRGGLCVIASPDGRRGSLRIHPDVVMFSALLDQGQHVVHELARGRSAWLHLVEGEVTVGDVVLGAGDGAGVDGVPALSFTARCSTEVMLLNLASPAREMHGETR